MSVSYLLANENTYTDLKVKSVSCDQIICNSHNSEGEMVIPVIPNADPLPTPENGSIISYNDGSGYEFWYCDGVAWHKVSGVSGSGDVQGPVGASDSHLTLYDGVTGKVIKNSNIKLTGVRFQGFDAFNNPIPIEFNGDTNHLGFDITNVGSIAPDTVNTNLITPKTGTFVSFNNKDIQDLNTVVSTNINTDFIGSGTGAIVEFSDKPQSSTAPTVNDDLTNKLYVDNAILGISGGDVSGPASSKNGYLTTYDGVSGKLIKSDSTVASTNNRIEAFDAFGLPNILEINSDTDHLGSDITNVGTIAPDSVNTDLIASKSGSTVSFNNKPQSSIAPTVNGDLTNKLYVDTQIGNFYAMLADGPTIIQSSPETSILASGVGDFVGTLTVPANGFAVGDAFHFVVAGDCVFDKDNEITLRLKNGGVLATITMELEDTTGTTSWELESDFIIRSIGATGSIVTNFDFTFNKKALKDFKGVRNVVVSSINTTVPNTLDITAEFTTNPDPSSITAKLAYLKRMH